MRLRHVLNTKSSPQELFTISAQRPATEMAMLMTKKDIGAVVVVQDDESDEVVGIATERDILRTCCQSGRHLDELKVVEVMRRDVVFAAPDDLVVDALRSMSRNSVRYLPIREEGKVIGIVSIGDVLRALYDEDEIHLRHLGEYLGGTYRSDVY
jgi:signal-transduction protein with cAMP-binding, CBS, and nucleotidyltransferase domain